MQEDMKEKIFAEMFRFRTKHHEKISEESIASYKKLFFLLREKQKKGKIPLHPNDYLNGNELAFDIFRKKYYLKDLDGNLIESRPEDVFLRLASNLAAVEPEEQNKEIYSERFYNLLYNGYFMPGGRVLAGAGDLFRLKTLANCFVTVISEDNIESIYSAAYDCARTYSYGGGIGVDISPLRPKNSIVHNAADKSTGSVSFMELYSMTTGLIGQSGRRGALMITLDVKHPDVLDFIRVKQNSNWITKQVADQCRWSGKFDDSQIAEVEKQVRENTQVRFANISLKVNDEFMNAVDESKRFNKGSILVYRKMSKEDIFEMPQDSQKNIHYAYKIPSKNLSDYQLLKSYASIEELDDFLRAGITEDDLKDARKRDIFGDLLVKKDGVTYAIHYAGEFMTYFGSLNTESTKRLMDVTEIWKAFVSGNYSTAEPGLIFWDSMTRYSPSNYLGKRISSTNPCGEVPLEDGGACNLGSINLARFVKNGYTNEAEIDWEKMKDAIFDVVRLLDNVIEWNISLNALSKQRDAARDTRRLGIGLMGIADMLNMMEIGYDSEEGIRLVEKVTQFLTENCYKASALIAKEKGPIPIWDFKKYSEGPFFKERLSEETKSLIKAHGLRNIALTSIAPTGTISNIVLGYKDGDKNYIGVSGGIEPIFALYYTRRSEQMNEGAFYKVFHSTVQAYIDIKGLGDKVKNVSDTAGLMEVLPAHFFRTSHFIKPESRIRTQAACQKYIDHSISSTVNLPESVEPEAISDIYIRSWKEGLKGITIYRDGSRFPILSVAQEMNEFQKFKDQKVIVELDGKEVEMKGDSVFMFDGRLTTPFHAMKRGLSVNKGRSSSSSETKAGSDPSETGGKACKVKFVDGKLIKECGD